MGCCAGCSWDFAVSAAATPGAAMAMTPCRRPVIGIDPARSWRSRTQTQYAGRPWRGPAVDRTDEDDGAEEPHIGDRPVPGRPLRLAIPDHAAVSADPSGGDHEHDRDSHGQYDVDRHRG